jgi:hypothetical protein
MNDFDNNNYCPFRNARWIADNASYDKGMLFFPRRN